MGRFWVIYYQDLTDSDTGHDSYYKFGIVGVYSTLEKATKVYVEKSKIYDYVFITETEVN